MSWAATSGSAFVGAAIAVLGHYLLQIKVVAPLREAEEVRRMLHKFVDLVSRYCLLSQKGDEYEKVKAEVISQHVLISGALSDISNHSRKLKTWYSNTEESRNNLLGIRDNPVGHLGNVQDKIPSKTERIRLASKYARDIISGLNQACYPRLRWILLL